MSVIVQVRILDLEQLVKATAKTIPKIIPFIVLNLYKNSMKNLIYEIRMLISEKLAGWALSCSPKERDGIKLIDCILGYFTDRVDENLTKTN